MITMKTDIVINRPVDEVYAVLADPDMLPRWASGVIEVKHDSGDPRTEGAKYTQVSMFLGYRMESSYEVTRVEPNRNFGIRTLSGPLHFEFDYRFEPEGPGTRVSVITEGAVNGVLQVGEPIMAAAGRRLVAANLGTLKDLMEAGELAVAPA